MSEADYDRGFAEALLFVADILRRCAAMVEAPEYANYDRNGGSIRGIKRTGSPQLAAKYREVATLLETATKDSTHD
jgi:hypothetical protein